MKHVRSAAGSGHCTGAGGRRRCSCACRFHSRSQPWRQRPTRPASRRISGQHATSEPTHIRAARYVWALLLARIYEVLPLLWPARRAQLWETPGRESGEIDPQAQPEPNYEFDLRVAW